MPNHKRARTRAIRAEMARSGENYTRSAAAVTESPTRPPAGCTDVVRDHIRRVLEGERRAVDARLRRAEQLERSGRRIVEGGMLVGDDWVIRDWRTGACIAKGSDGLAGYDAAVDRLDPNGTWFEADNLYDEVPAPRVTTPGLPRFLELAIEDWIALLSTSDEEIADFIGWSVEKVRAHR